MSMRRATIPVENIPEEAIKRIDSLVEKGEFEWSVESQQAWSHSKYKTLHKCPIKYLLGYVLKIDATVVDELDDISSLRHIGTTAHTILELARQGMSVSDAYEKAKEMHLKDVTEEYWPNVENLRYNIEEFLHRFRAFELREKVDTAYTELKLAVDRDWKPVAFGSKKAYFRGIVDLPIVLQNQDAIIVDHKHGGSAQFGLRNYNEQLDSYKALLYFGKRKVKGAAAGINFIKEGDIVIGHRSNEDAIKRIPAKIDMYIYSSVEFVNEMGYFNHQRNSLCKYCDYQPICHGGKRGTANLLTPVIEKSKELIDVSKSKAEQGAG